MKKLKYILILLLAPLALNAQCVFDTIPPGPPFPPYSDTTQVSLTLDCYTACQACPTSFSVTIPPMDGCLIIDGDQGWIAAIVRDSCNLVLKDTCMFVAPAAAVVGQLCYSYTKHTLLTVCRDTATAMTVQYASQFGTGWPLLTPIVDIDTLCSPLPPPVYIIPTIKVDTILIGSYDLQGRPWKSGPCIEVYQVGEEYYVRKWWDVYKK